MDMLNVHHDLPHDDDDDFGDAEARPLLGWFLMAVALVAMAFLIGGNAPQGALAESARAASQGTAAVTAVAGAVTTDHMAFGG